MRVPKAPPFRWLHLSDFRLGTSNFHTWNIVRHALTEDLRRLHQRCGPWDVIFVSGGLTLGGTQADFEHFAVCLNELRAEMAEIGGLPPILAVPGSSEVLQPSISKAAHKVLTDWHSHKDAHNALWDDSDSEYVQVIRASLDPYQTWWEKQRDEFPQNWEFTPGWLPGDWSLSIIHGGYRIGIVGLNSCYLQFTRKQGRPGEPNVDFRQLDHACKGNGSRWTQLTDLNFLVTHHGPDDLGSVAKEQLRGQIDVPARFVAHLHGHMHERNCYMTVEGHGAAARRRWQAPPIMGQPHYPEHCGYAAGVLEFAAGQVRCRLWSRRGASSYAGPLRMGVDPKELLGPEQADERYVEFEVPIWGRVEGSTIMGSAEVSRAAMSSWGSEVEVPAPRRRLRWIGVGVLSALVVAAVVGLVSLATQSPPPLECASTQDCALLWAECATQWVCEESVIFGCQRGVCTAE